MAIMKRLFSDIVESGLCIGCGLCEAFAGRAAVEMVMTPEGRERPLVKAPVEPAAIDNVYATCPGIVIRALDTAGFGPEFEHDDVWGQAGRIVLGWAGDDAVRRQQSSGGTLSALAIHLLETGEVDFILHLGASAERPMRSERRLSYDRAQVLDRTQSRYGPGAPLADFLDVLAMERPFAFIGKPCDVAAVRNVARRDPRVDRYCRYTLTMLCGGASELGLSEDMLDDFDLDEDEVSVFRYRGGGNCPGPTHIETKDGRVFEKGYNEVWADESGWQLQFRCKVCPDAIGEQADIAAGDLWPGGAPEGETPGENCIIARTPRGLDLLRRAEAAGALHIERPLTFRDLDDAQPHQVERKRAILPRLIGLTMAGQKVPSYRGMRLWRLARGAGWPFFLDNVRGLLRRSRQRKTREPTPRRGT